jgi:hypothetical protein
VYVSRLEISGVKGFSGVREVDLDFARADGSYPGWTVLAGRNGSGKTSLLRALVVGLGLYEPDDVAEWPSDDGAFIRVTVSPADWDELLLLLDDDSDEEAEDASPGERLTELFEAAPDVVVTCSWPKRRGRNAELQARPRRQFSLVASDADRAYRHDFSGDLWEFTDLRALVAVGAFRRLGRELGRSTGFGAAVDSLFNEDATLAEGVFWLVETHHRSLSGDTAAAEVLALVMRLLGDGLLPDGYAVSGVDADGLWVSRDGHRFALGSMSDGFRTVVALAVHILWAQVALPFDRRVQAGSVDGRTVVLTPGVVLIDEADAHLHVSWQQRIGYWLKQHFPHVQFIVTTHSPYVCQAADPGGLIRLGAPGDGTTPGVVHEELYRRVVYGSGDDAVLSDLFGLESPYSPAAEEARRRIGDLEGRVLQGDASEAEIAEYDALGEKLNSSLSARVDEVAARLARRP